MAAVASAPPAVKQLDGEVPLVLVTGATGYIGGWTVATLLAAGYRVRGTVRSTTSKKVDVLKALPGADNLELVAADLLQSKDKWLPALKDCTFVLHVASPFFVGTDEDKLVKPAVEGTKVVLLAARETKSVKRVVVTASVASIMYGHGDINKQVWTPEDHSVPDGPDIDTYCKSKTLAEDEAWKIARGEGEYASDGKASFELATIHPGLVSGPVLGNIGKFTSMDILLRILNGNSMVDGGFPSIDVRDVARAHVLAMVTPSAAGHRFITTHSSMPLIETQKALADEFNGKGYSVSTSLTPTFLINCLACCSRDVATAQSLIGKFPKLDSSSTTSILGLRFYDQAQSFVDMGHSAIQHGYVEDKSKDKELSKMQPALHAPFVEGLMIKGKSS